MSMDNIADLPKAPVGGEADFATSMDQQADLTAAQATLQSIARRFVSPTVPTGSDGSDILYFLNGIGTLFHAIAANRELFPNAISRVHNQLADDGMRFPALTKS
jgi:hypothetical protein